MGTRSLRDNARVYFFGALGGMLFGYDTGVISGAILFIPNDFKLTPFLEGAVVAGTAARRDGRRGHGRARCPTAWAGAR